MAAVSAIVLAAGAGVRLGGPKALVELNGRTFVDLVVATCRAAPVDDVVVVTGAEAARVDAAVPREEAADLPPVRVVRNERWAEGRTGSLQAGWRTLPPSRHVLVFPVDHPLVRVVTLDALLGVFGYAAALPEVVVPVLEDADGRRRRGHPIVLAAPLRDEVLALGPDSPLHDVVHRHVVLEVPVDDPGILLDIDTPEDLSRAR